MLEPDVGRGGSNAHCNDAAHLVCLGTDLNTPLQFSPALGRLAFVTNQTLPAANVATQADALCNTEAGLAGWLGTFKAWFMPGSVHSLSRFNLLGQPWIRPDGVALVRDTADLLTGNLVAPIDRTPSRTGDYSYVWTGSSTPGSTTPDNCSNWTATSGMGIVGSAAHSGPGFWGNAYDFCATGRTVYCLQE